VVNIAGTAPIALIRAISGGLSIVQCVIFGRALARGNESPITLTNVNSPFVNMSYRLYYELIPAGGGAPSHA